MDNFLQAAAEFAGVLIPTLTAIVLIYLAVFLRKLTQIVGSLNPTIKETEKTVSLVNTSIEKAQAPLDTVVKVSHSVDDFSDKASDTLSKATESAKTFVNKNMETVKNTGSKLKRPDEVIENGK